MGQTNFNKSIIKKKGEWICDVSFFLSFAK